MDKSQYMTHADRDIAVQIHYGCNHRCTFCGPEYIDHEYVSFKPSIILKDIVSLNTNEIILSGVDITAYDYQGFSLLDLIKYILNKSSVTIALSHINPADDGVIQLIKFIDHHPRIIQHTILACQSLSDTVLTRMHTDHTVKRIMNIIDAATSFKFTGQLITGFPGETEEEFQETLQLIDRFPVITVSGYVERYRSAAVDIYPKVPLDIIKKRINILNQHGNRHKKEYKNNRIITTYLQTKHDENAHADLLINRIYMTQETVNNIIAGTCVFAEQTILTRPETDKPTKESFIRACKMLKDVSLSQYFKDDRITEQDLDRTDFSDCIDLMRHVVDNL